MKLRTNVKAGEVCPVWECGSNHNETLVRAKGLKVKTQVKAGGLQTPKDTGYDS